MASHMLRFVVTALRMSQTVFYVNCRFNGRRDSGGRAFRPSSRASFVSAPLAGLHATSQHRQSCNRFATHGRLPAPSSRNRVLVITAQAARVASRPAQRLLGTHVGGGVRARPCFAPWSRYTGDIYPDPSKGGERQASRRPLKLSPAFSAVTLLAVVVPQRATDYEPQAQPLQSVRFLRQTEQSRHGHRASVGVSGVAGGVLLSARVRPE